MYYFQKETTENTLCPADSKGHVSGAGYLPTEHNFTSFHQAGELHLAVDWENLEEGNGIAWTFESHCGSIWHKSCCDECDNKTALHTKKENVSRVKKQQTLS